MAVQVESGFDGFLLGTQGGSRIGGWWWDWTDLRHSLVKVSMWRCHTRLRTRGPNTEWVWHTPNDLLMSYRTEIRRCVFMAMSAGWERYGSEFF